MKLAVVLVCAMMAMWAHGAPQAGPPLDRPWNTYSEHCRPSPCASHGLYNASFPLDCVQYVECNEGVAKARPCPPNLFWHEEAKKCAERKIANCLECWR